MWFKNIRAYRLSAPFGLSAEQLEDKLQNQVFQPCGKTQPFRTGWVAPLGNEGGLLVHAANGRLLVCMRREERLLPASVIREELVQRVTAIEERQERKVHRREKDALKDDIMMDCLPRAFTRATAIFAYIDVAANWLLVDSVSVARAEELTTLLRESIGTLPLLLPEVNNSPAAVMTSWLQLGNMPADMLTGYECELRDPTEDGGVVRCRRQDLSSEEIKSHLEAGKRVVKLAVEWNEQLSLVLGEDLSLRRLRFNERLQETNDDIDSEDRAARFDADFVLMSETLTPLMDKVLDYFGGECKGS
jgi:recombination associated protein RdgC